MFIERNATTHALFFLFFSGARSMADNWSPTLHRAPLKNKKEDFGSRRSINRQPVTGLGKRPSYFNHAGKGWKTDMQLSVALGLIANCLN
jgi:hypothetical protein